jgi:predicted RNA-binding Zn ribbon-like protein
MEKEENPRFLCLDFVNSDLSKAETVERLVKYIIYFFEDEGYNLNRDTAASLFRNRVLTEMAALRTLQKDIAQFIDHSISQKKAEITDGQRFHRFENFVENAAEAIYYDFKLASPSFNVVKDFLIPLLCDDLVALDEEGYWSRIKTCKACSQYFIPGTRSNPRDYCSANCLNHHFRRGEAESRRPLMK